MKLVDYYKNNHIYASFNGSLFLNILTWALLAWRIFPQSNDIILHYNIYYGADRIGPAWQAGFIPLLGLIILVANFFVGFYFIKKQEIISITLNYLTLFLHTILILGTILLVLANL